MNMNRVSLFRILCLFALISLLSGVIYAVAQERLDTPADVATYLKNQTETQSEEVAFVVYSVGEDGAPLPEDSLSYNADTPLPLASTFKITVLAAYAQAVSEGELDPAEEVTVKDWEAYYLPGTDGGAHPAALELLGISTDDLGAAKDENAVIPLEAVASAMIVQSDNAATDYLITRVGEDALVRVTTEGGLTRQDLPPTLLGTFLAWGNHERPETPDYQDVEDLREDARLYEEKYLSDSAWREAQLEWLGAHPTGSAELSQSFTRGSAADYAHMMAGVVTRTFISPEVSEIMQGILEWPMEQPGTEESLVTFGAKGGNLPGVITEAFYLTPKAGDFANQPRVAVLLMNRLPDQAYADLSETFAQQQLLLALASQQSTVQDLGASLPPEE